MADLSTSFMGIELTSPVVVGACALSKSIDNIKKAESAGAGAAVMYSLFQEQLELDAEELDEALTIGADSFAESLTYFPHLDYAGSREHIMWVEKTRKAVGFPIIGSLNAVSTGNWIGYAQQLESAGCNGLELNLYSVETNPEWNAEDVEKRQLDVVSAVKASVKIPVAVKIGPWYTAVANFALRAVEAGADALVLFNRFYQPIIDADNQALRISLDLSRPEDIRLPLRWIAILSGELNADLVASTGVHSGKDVVRQLLAGAKVAQTVSALYKNGIDYVAVMNREISNWMDDKGYSTIEAFRGKVNQKQVPDPYAFERAQYVKLLLVQE